MKCIHSKWNEDYPNDQTDFETYLDTCCIHYVKSIFLDEVYLSRKKDKIAKIIAPFQLIIQFYQTLRNSRIIMVETVAHGRGTVKFPPFF